MTKTKLTPYEAYGLMIQDYNDTLDGRVEPIFDDSFMMGEQEKPEEYLSQLRRSIGNFAIGELDMDLEHIARDLNLNPDVLLEDLQKDEELIKLTKHYTDRLLKPDTSFGSMCEIDLAKIGWVASNDKVNLQIEKVEASEEPYYFVDLTGMNRTTELMFEKLNEEGKQSDLLRLLKADGIPRIRQSILTGKGSDIRPVNYIKNSKSRNLNTTYPTYKLGLNGSQNRAFIMLLGNRDELPIYGLVAMCDHDDQDKVIDSLKV